MDLETFLSFKTKPCQSEDCTYQKRNQLQNILASSLSPAEQLYNCPGYHGMSDKRRFPLTFKAKNDEQSNDDAVVRKTISFLNLQKKSSHGQSSKIPSAEIYLSYRQSFLQEGFSLYRQSDSNCSQPHNPICNNWVEYLFHPKIYKTMMCPFTGTKGQPDKTVVYSISEGSQHAQYCPYIHENDEPVNSELFNLLSSDTQPLGDASQTHKIKEEINQKILKLIILRTAKSIEDLADKENRLFLGMERDNSQKSTENVNFQNKDLLSIQRIKKRLLQKVVVEETIDSQKLQEQESRKINLQSVSGNNAQNKQANKRSTEKMKSLSPVTKVNPKQGIKQQPLIKNSSKSQPDSPQNTYEYFIYGQKLSLIESRSVEFKAIKDLLDPSNPMSTHSLVMKYVSAFLNSGEGGQLFIGIDDSSYVYGSRINQSDYDKLLLSIDQEARFNMSPPVIPQKYTIRRIPVYSDRGRKMNQQHDRWVIEVTVHPSQQEGAKKKKLYLHNRECYMRMNASTHRLNAADIIEYLSHRRQFDPLENIKAQMGRVFDHSVESPHNEAKQKQESPSQGQNKSGFVTEQARDQQFEQFISSKSVEELYELRSKTEQRLMKITAQYKKKEIERRAKQAVLERQYR